jgi:hypothetical protein
VIETAKRPGCELFEASPVHLLCQVLSNRTVKKENYGKRAQDNNSKYTHA